MSKHEKTVADLMDKLLLEGRSTGKQAPESLTSIEKLVDLRRQSPEGIYGTRPISSEDSGLGLEMDEDRGCLIREPE